MMDHLLIMKSPGFITDTKLRTFLMGRRRQGACKAQSCHENTMAVSCLDKVTTNPPILFYITAKILLSTKKNVKETSKIGKVWFDNKTYLWD